jgi:hypothetical protein
MATLAVPTSAIAPRVRSGDDVRVSGRTGRLSLRPPSSFEPALRTSRGVGLPAGDAANHFDAAAPAAAVGRR